MGVINRLKLFLNSNNIGSSEFADNCEISRPTVSQLLNGRNKKISNEIIDKIHKAYPSLSVMWLMFGEGVMLTHSNGDDIFNNEFNVTENSIFDVSVDEVSENTTLADVNDDIKMIINAPKHVASINDNITDAPDAARKIVNIMIFYSDNSFESFKP
ncbi:MAG: helix-turn-helix transcriptional regulator [Bacteroidales bacterium]